MHSVQNWSRVYSFGGGDITDNAYHLAWTRGTGQNTQRMEKQGPGPADSNLATDLDREYHIVAMWDGDSEEYRWYRDGELAASQGTAGQTLDEVDDTVMWLGRSQWGDATANASWNEFRMYDGALSDLAIATNNALGPDDLHPSLGGGDAIFQIDSVTFDAATREATLTWESAPGQKFSVDWSSDLQTPWTELADDVEAGAGDTTSFADTVPEGARERYYRVHKL
jgi:hypothetical protein